LAVVVIDFRLISGAPQGPWPAKDARSTSPLPPAKVLRAILQ